MAKELLNALLAQLDGAFEGDREHSLLGNLRNVGEADWVWRPSGSAEEGGRSIHDIVWHVGACKYMYEDYAFGDGSRRWDEPFIDAPAEPRPMGEMLEWVHAGHARLVDSVGALADDAELERLRLTNWGEQLATRRIIEIMVMHDLYHAGEINHLRALAQGNDHWGHYDNE